MAWRVVMTPGSITERRGWSIDWAKADTDPLVSRANARQQDDRMRVISGSFR
jgi:hypothetical protein